MTDQQDAPLCPHGHGPMQEMEWGQGPYYIAWRCVDPTCGAIGEAFLLEQEYQRGRAGEHGLYVAAKRDAEQQRQRAEASEARVRELEDALRNIAEYWNGAETPEAMSDALHYIGSRVDHALAGTCPRCGNPQPDCQCYGSKAMAEDYRQPQDEAPHGRCWCGAPLEQRIWHNEGADGFWCSANAEHAPCPNCGQWVKWARRAGWYDHRPGADAMPCPGPALHGYCPRHPGTPLQNHPPEHDGATGYLWCPKCEEAHAFTGEKE